MLPAAHLYPGRNDSPAVTVVVPTYNEVDNIEPLVARLSAVLDPVSAEVLFVDDSTDTTPQAVRRAATGPLPVRLLHRDRPDGGLAGAVVAGIGASRAEWVVVMDGDLQHPPEVVPSLLRRASAGDVDAVVASRYVDGGDAGGLDGVLRRAVSTWSGRVARGLFPRRLAACSDPMSGFFAVRRDALALDEVTRCGYKVLLALLVHRPLAVGEVGFRFAERQAGESKASLREGMRYLRLLAELRLRPPARPRTPIPATPAVPAFPGDLSATPSVVTATPLRSR